MGLNFMKIGVFCLFFKRLFTIYERDLLIGADKINY